MIKKIVDYIHYNVDELKLKFAIHMADKAHSQNGKRYYVMPDEKDQLIIMHRPSFRKMKRSGQMSYQAKVVDLKRESFYFTPYYTGVKRDEQKDKPIFCDYKDNLSFLSIEIESITPEIQEAKRLMFHKYMKESRLRKIHSRLPFLLRIKIRLKLLAIQYKMAIR